MSQLQQQYGFSLEAVHVNHSLRVASNDEQEKVQAYCKALGGTCKIYKAPNRENSENIEAWARKVRYQFFNTRRDEVGAHYLVTAHHRRDQAETILFRILTGRALGASHGITESCSTRGLLRPLLGISKEEIEAYAALNEVPYVIDETNSDIARTRNRIRHELLPRLEADYNPSVEDHLARLASRWADDEAYLRQEARVIFNRNASQCQVADLLSLAPSMQWRVLQEYAVNQLGREAEQLGFDAFQRILQMLEDNGDTNSRCLDIGYGVIAELANTVVFRKASEKLSLERIVPQDLNIPSVNKWRFDDGTSITLTAQLKVIDVGDYEKFLEQSRSLQGTPLTQSTSYFDARGDLSSLLRVRGREEGDIVRVWGRGRRKLKKLFQEKKLILTLRNRIPIVACKGDILWVPGIARSDYAAVVPDTREVIELVYQFHAQV